ncbi:MAG: alpha/beta fold hydrolase [Oscillospiraceae bacterium]
MDIQLHFTETGTGEPLVLLHGNGEDSSYFVHQVEFFSPRRRVLAVDTRGHGRSPRGSAPFTIRQFAEDLLAFLDERGIGRTDLLGFSDGANIALVFALRYPERVRRLILNGANLDPAGVKRSVQIPIELGYRMASLFAKKSADAKQYAELLGLMVNDPMIPAEELGKLSLPTLVIAGTKDMIREKHTRMIADALPNARLDFVPGDHFIANKNPEEFNRAVADFLAETEG